MKLRSLGRMACLGLIASICFSSSQAEAVLASVKTVGRALTQCAYPEDALCVSINPAGGAFIGSRFDAGFHVDIRRQSATITDNAATVPVQIPGDGVVLVPVPGTNGTFPADKTKVQYLPDLGINYEFGCENEYSFGFASFNRAFTKTSYNTNFTLFGTTNLGLDFLSHQVSFYGTYKLNNCHAIGISFNVLVNRLKITGLELIANPPFGGPFSEYPNAVTNRGYNYRTGYGATIGYQGKITDTLSIGVAVTPEVKNGKFTKYKGFLVQGKLNAPWRIAAGIAYRFLPNATIAFDWEYEAFNGIRTLHNKVNLPNPFDPPLGNRNATGFGWRGVNFYRVGLDYTFAKRYNTPCPALDGLTLRAGFRYGNPLFKKSQNLINALDCLTGHIGATCGFTYELSSGSEISAYYIHLFKSTQHGPGSFPAALGGGNVTLRQRQNLWGIGWGKSF